MNGMVTLDLEKSHLKKQWSLLNVSFGHSLSWVWTLPVMPLVTPCHWFWPLLNNPLVTP